MKQFQIPYTIQRIQLLFILLIYSLMLLSPVAFADEECHAGNNSSTKPPSSFFTLTNFKLTLPISKDECFESGLYNEPDKAAEIFPVNYAQNNQDENVIALDSGFILGDYPYKTTADYFYTSSTGSMVFKTPLTNFATTNPGDSDSNPRTELRELFRPNDKSWTFDGTHHMAGSCRITEFNSSDPDTKKTVFAQIHGDGVKPLIKMVWRNNGEVYALVKKHPNEDDDITLSSLGHANLGDSINYKITLDNRILTILVITNENPVERTVEVDNNNGMHEAWLNKKLYFKAGNYAQIENISAQQSGDFIEVQYDSLSAGHSGEAPLAAPLISPNGNISDNTPTYTWQPVVNSTWYYLWVNDSTGNVIKKWYQADELGCANGIGICSITPTTALAAGSGVWWVQTWNSTAYGPWSNSKSFTVDVTSPPIAAPLISPNGNISDNTPTYTWQPVVNSTWYYLWVNDSTGNVIRKWYRAGELACANGIDICSITPTTALAAGNGVWWVQTWNSTAYGPWSSKSFSVGTD